MNNLIVDMSGLLISHFMRNNKYGVELDSVIAKLTTLRTINKYFRKYKPDQVILCFDGVKNWRKDFSKNNPNSRKIYKDHRNKKMDVKLAEAFTIFKQSFPIYIDFFKNHTSCIVLQDDRLEADDLIAGYIQHYFNEKHILLSNDNDFLQLLKYDVKIINGKSQELNLNEYDSDPNYFLYQKMFRGDIGDNVASAYPRLTSKKIKAAYMDSLTEVNIMEHEFSDLILVENEVVEKNFKTKDVFECNKVLMDLSCQPIEIRDLIESTIVNYTPNKFKSLYAVMYCSKNGLKEISKNVDEFKDLFSVKKRD